MRQRGMEVAPIDPQYPLTMRVYVPSTMALGITETAARELAGTVRTRLHSDAIVYIMSKGGQQLAKATPWGFD